MVKKKGKKIMQSNEEYIAEKQSKKEYQELIESQMYKEFEECHPEFSALMEACYDGYWDKESFLEWAEWNYESICDPEELDWIYDWLQYNPKEVYQLRARIKYRLNKWLYNEKGD